MPNPAQNMCALTKVGTVLKLSIYIWWHWLQCLRWPNTFLGPHILMSFFSKILASLLTKNSNTQVNNINFGFLIAKLTFVPLQWEHE